jgi:hypothetical protein
VATISRELHAAGKETIVSVHPLNGWFHGYDYAALAGVSLWRLGGVGPERMAAFEASITSQR